MGWFTERRRREITEKAFPKEWRDILATNLRAADLLDPDERARLEQLVQVFIDEKKWTGCDGKVITDEVRLTIGGIICAMLVAHEHDLLPKLEEILVYPTAFEIPEDAGFYINNRRKPKNPLPAGRRQAIAIPNGPLIVAWDAALNEGRAVVDRRPVVHEIARHLDSLDGSYDGMPPVEIEAEKKWRAAFTTAFEARREAAMRGQPSELPESALASATEYFASATELFFARPRDLALEQPNVYACLVEYFGMNLAGRAPTPYR